MARWHEYFEKQMYTSTKFGKIMYSNDKFNIISSLFFFPFFKIITDSINIIKNRVFVSLANSNLNCICVILGTKSRIQGIIR